MKKTQAKRAGARSKPKPRAVTKQAGHARVAKQSAGRKGSAARTAKPSAPEDDFDIASIERLVQLMTDNDLLEIEVRNGPNRRVRLSRRPPDVSTMLVSAPGSATAPFVQGTLGPAGAAPGAEGAAPSAGDMAEFVSPMVGTFYRAPTPESPPYVMANDRVNGETVLCIIEAMKVMNEIKAEVEGEIVDILVENGEAVEFGQPLFLIRKMG